jgi:hypothetical protein
MKLHKSYTLMKCRVFLSLQASTQLKNYFFGKLIAIFLGKVYVCDI